MSDFKPCPFCGGPAGEVGLEFVTCLSAEIGTEQTCPGKQIRVDVEDAERWNIRRDHAPAAGQPVAYMTSHGFKNWMAGSEPEIHVLLRGPGGTLPRIALYAAPPTLSEQFERIIKALNYQGGVNGDENSLTVGEIRRAL